VRIGKRFIYFEDYFGLIKAHYISKETLYVDELIVYKSFRGNGFGKLMAKMLPIGTKLLASTIPDDDGTIADIDLIGFYSSCGFELISDKHGNPYMRKIC